MLKVGLKEAFSLARPVKWSRDLYPILERARLARTETWSRKDIEDLFGTGRATAQMLMEAIGEIQTVDGAHFVERPALLSFLDTMIATPSVEEGLRSRRLEAEPPPKPKPLRVSLPQDLRSAMIPCFPGSMKLSPGRLEIEAPTAIAMVESLMTLALIMQNDLDRFEATVDPPAPAPEFQDCEIQDLIVHLRESKVRVQTRAVNSRITGQYLAGSYSVAIIAGRAAGRVICSQPQWSPGVDGAAVAEKLAASGFSHRWSLMVCYSKRPRAVDALGFWRLTKKRVSELRSSLIGFEP